MRYQVALHPGEIFISTFGGFVLRGKREDGSWNDGGGPESYINDYEKRGIRQDTLSSLAMKSTQDQLSILFKEKLSNF